MVEPTPQKTGRRLALAGLLLLIVVIAWAAVPAVFAPQSITHTDPQTDAQVNFQVGQQVMLVPGTCTTVTWDVRGIQALYLDEGGVIGQDDTEICVDVSPFTTSLSVDYTDGRSATFTLSLFLVLGHPFAWAVALAGVFCLLLGGLVLRRWVTVVAATGLAGFALFGLFGVLLPQSVLGSMVWLQLMALTLAAGLAGLHPADTPNTRAQRFGLLCLVLLLPAGLTSVPYTFATMGIEQLQTVARRGSMGAALVVLAVVVWIMRVPPARQKQYLANGLLVVVGGTGALLLMESGLRFLAPPPQATEREVTKLRVPADDNTLYGMYPDTTWQHRYPAMGNGDPLVVTYQTNPAGYRDQPFDQDRTPGVHRVALIGDSFAMGIGVPQDEVAATEIERQLATVYDCPTEIYNFSVPGNNALAYKHTFQHRVLEYNPDVVLIWYFLNDIGISKSEFFEDVSVESSPYFPMMGHRLRVVNLMSGWLHQYAQAETSIQRFHEAYQDSARWQMVDDSLATISQDLAETDTRFGLYIHPILFRLSEHRYPYHAIHEQVLDLADQYGYFTADLFEALEGYDYSRLWVHPEDSHPNAIAHKAAADYAARQLAPVLGCTATP